MAVDQLKSVIISLTEDEKKEFRVFTQRQRSKDKRRDLELFEIIAEYPEKKPKDIIHELYNSENREAYNMLRKRLIKQLIDFVALKRMDEDETAAAKVMGMLSLSQHLFSRDLPQIGWSYLKKSEDLAYKSELHDLMDNIFNLQIEQWHPEFAPDIETIVHKLEENGRQAKQDEKVNVLAARIRYLLHKHKTGSLDEDLSVSIRKLFYDTGISHTFSKKPNHLLKILSIIRIGVLVEKDFSRFEPMIIEEFEKVENDGGFTKRNVQIRIELLYMIAHVLYRNRNFERCLKYLQELKKAISSQNKSLIGKFYPKYILLYASAKSYLGFNQESVKLIEGYILNFENRLSKRYILDLKLNLTVFYFQNQEYYKANQVLLTIHHSDKWCEKKMGKEWMLRKNLVDVINQYERENYEIALSRLNGIERSFSKLLSTTMYSRVKTFIGLIKYLINYPEEVATESFFQKVDDKIERLPTDQEDLLAMAFYCWLKAKMQKQPYYQVLVQTVNDSTLKG